MFEFQLYRLHGLKGRAYSLDRQMARYGMGGQPTTGPGGGGSGNTPPPVKPAPPPSYQGPLDAFTNFLNQQNPYFTNAADSLLQRSQGVDPAFDAYRQSVLAQNNLQQGSQLSALNSSLAQRGVTGSAAQNQVNQLNAGFNANNNVLTSQIGLQGLQEQDQNLQNSLGARSAAITQAGTPTALSIAALAAQNSGKGGGSSGGTVICTLLHENGDLPEIDYQETQSFSRRNLSLSTYIGYRAWADPLVRAAKAHPWLYKAIVRPLGRHWARYLAFRASGYGQGVWLGRILFYAGVGPTWLLGKLIREVRKWHMFSQPTSLRS